MSIIFTYEETLHPDAGSFRIHTHNLFEIYFFLDGNVSYLVEGNLYPMRPGTLMLMRPGEMHCANIKSDCHYERCYFYFAESDLKELDPQQALLKPFFARSLGSRNRYGREELDMDFLLSCLKRIEKAADNPALQHLYIKTYLPVILCEIYDSFTDPSDSSGAPAYEEDIIHEIIHYINQNLGADLSLEHLEKRFYISKPYLGSRFKQATGTTVWNYILTKRLILANQLLQSGKPATEVAHSCGFSDYSAFYRAYKKKFDVSPRTTRAISR